ncbi:MAG: cytochrome C oxidase subunit II, partial [Actinobacteria bacterium]|nr:cytochrome C oxidase subunit II [Actinomycetota bacterium]
MPSKRLLRWVAVPVGIATAVTLAGCTPTELHGFLPGFTEDGQAATNHTDMVAGLWVNSWIVLLIVGVITWGLTIFAMIAYRRRRGQTGLPAQLRYNMPIEIFYTI